MIVPLLAIAASLAAGPSDRDAARRPGQGEPIYIRNARIYTVSGAVIENGSIVIQDGKIKAVGSAPAPSAGATVIDGTGLSVIPGIVDASARFGLVGQPNEQGAEVTPQIRAADLVDPRGAEFQRAVQSGVTCACVTPGSLNTVGGLCTVLKTAGSSGRLVREGTALSAALGSDVFSGNGAYRVANPDALANIFLRRPNSRMGAVWELRHALFEAARFPALVQVTAGSLPLRIHARIENDIRAALTIADEFKLRRLVLDECTEGYKLPDLLAARQASVVLGPLFDPQTAGGEGADGCLNSAGILTEKGVRVAFGSNGGDPGQLLTWSALSVRAGLKPELALRAVTLSAAEVAGVADRVGSIEAGKDADLVILSGDPLEVTSRIRTVIVNGQVVYENK